MQRWLMYTECQGPRQERIPPEMGVTPQVIDFSDVPESGGRRFKKIRQEAGDYEATILKVEDSPTKEGKEPQWLFTIQVGRGVYPYYVKSKDKKQFWKIRQLLKAAGLNVPSKRVKVDPTKVVGKKIAVTLEDDDYDGKDQSTIDSVFPLSELNKNVPDQDDDEEEVDDEEVEETVDTEEEDDEDEDDEPPPPPKKKGKKKKAAPAPTIDDDELDEIEVEDL